MILSANSLVQTSQAHDEHVVFRLYIAGRAPHSLRAIANLAALCQQYLPHQHQIELVDVLEEPMRALTDGVLVTPALVKVSPPPTWQMIGDLSQQEDILLALGMRAHE